MRSGNESDRRKLSVGSRVMLVMLLAVLAGSALVLGRLSSGASVDLSKLRMNVLALHEDPSRNTAGNPTEASQEGESLSVRRQDQSPAAATAISQDAEDCFTMTIGGSISLSGEVRKNSTSTDARVADYADIMMLLAPRIHSDVNAAFIENILSDRHKTGDVVAPGQAATLLKEAGFDTVACGFSQAYAFGKDGVEATLMSLDSRGISTLGIHYADQTVDPEIKSIKRIRTAFLQYTATVPAKTRKTMENEETSNMVPEAEISLITQDIDLARKHGAEAVIVLISWGKIGKDPDKSQRELAEEIAAAGADLIVGNGSHLPQTAEYLNGPDGRSVLCVWSLGTVLSGDRTSIKRMSGYLLHVTVKRNGKGGVTILNPEYTPVYIWKYKQDGRFYYRCVASDGEAPDGMDGEQIKTMAKSAETVEAILKDTPINRRGLTDAP